MKTLIGFCDVNDLEKLQHFLHNHWRENHILARSKVLMDWMYFNKEKRRYNFIIAKNEMNEILAILGYVSPRHYDHQIEIEDIWQTIWKVRDDVNLPGLGLVLHKFLLRELKPRSVGGIGLSKMVIPLSLVLGFQHGIAKQYYLLNDKKQSFKIIKTNGHTTNAEESQFGDLFMEYDVASLQCLPQSVLDKLFFRVPSKSVNFIINRYLKHPFYKYTILGPANIIDKPHLIIVRKITINDSVVLRIVDFFGHESFIIGNYYGFQNLLTSINAEYIDFYCSDLDHGCLVEAGFRLKQTATEVVPDHFEPFERRNIQLDFVYKLESKSPYSIFKGDSDQDRPNLL